MELPFHDRYEAGKNLAKQLDDLRGRDDLLVLGLPRGGIPVAYEVALALQAPLDAYIVRKLGVPGHEELAMGAIATGDVTVLNHAVIDEGHISEEAIDAVVASEKRELHRRERLYRGTQPPPDVRDHTVVLVDDGLATGTTMRAAIKAVQQLDPREVVMAVPVASPSVCESFRDMVARVECGATPETFYALGMWYEDFTPTTDEEVQSLLAKAERRPDIPAPTAQQRESGQQEGGNGASAPLPEAITARSRPLTGDAHDYDALLDEIGDARLVLIGEATHGTQEFYQQRADITRRLIAERGFQAVVGEADWPDAFRVNRYVRGRSDDDSAVEALDDFERFPQWMWRNTVVRDFVEWLRDYNSQHSDIRAQAGFYGMDLYSLTASIEAVITYLDTADPEAAARARARYACFDQYADNAQVYGYATSLGAAEPCEDAVVNQLMELRRHAGELAMRDGQLAEDEFFSAEQNARLAKNAEEYYRSMFRGRVSSWNLRDTHMVDTLDALLNHLTNRNGKPAKIVVWAHNSHLGDARATQVGMAGEVNVGQLVRERHGDDAFLIGQTTHHGTVTAASDWDGPGERKRVRPGLEHSYEALFHEAGHDAFLLPLRNADDRLQAPRLQRAIGVIYLPQTERMSHYFDARIAEQFDVVIHRDETAALQPLAPEEEWHRGEAPETYPFADDALIGRRPA